MTSGANTTESVTNNFDKPQSPSITDLQFTQKVLEIPIVSKSVDLYQQRIAPVVEKNPITKYAADTAAYVVTSVTTPVLKAVGPEKVDKIGLKALEVGENVVSTGNRITEKVILSPLDKAVKGVEHVVDWVLPATDAEREEFVDAKDSTAVQEGEEKPAPFKRAYEVTQKAGTRVYNVVSSKGQKAYANTEEALHLRATWEIVQQYHTQLEASSQKLRETLASTQAYLQETVSDREKFAQSVQDVKEFGIEKVAKPTMESVLVVQNRLVEALADVRSSVNYSIDAVRQRLPKLPFNIQENLTHVVTGASKRWEETMKKVNEQAVNGEAQPVSIEALLANVRNLTQKSIKVIDASTESIEVLARAKAVLGSYLGINKGEGEDGSKSEEDVPE